MYCKVHAFLSYNASTFTFYSRRFCVLCRHISPERRAYPCAYVEKCFISFVLIGHGKQLSPAKNYDAFDTRKH